MDQSELLADLGGIEEPSERRRTIDECNRQLDGAHQQRFNGPLPSPREYREDHEADGHVHQADRGPVCMRKIHLILLLSGPVRPG
jgi:hypothetical protein